MARLPICPDVAALIGPAAEAVQNRSLLLDKFVYHKDWGRDDRADEAHRWTLLRISDGGSSVLQGEANRLMRRAQGQDVEPQNRTAYQNQAELAKCLANTKVEAEDAQKIRQSHTRRFIGLFRKAYGERARITVGQLEGRLAINLADGLIQNAGISLDRLFGLPFIPGSAVKGTTRHAAMREIKAAEGELKKTLLERFCRIFGTAESDALGSATNQKGAIAFLPAYPLSDARVVVDVTTVHYPEYYRSGRAEDLAKEKPRPNPFPVVEAGAQFGFCLVLNGVSEDPVLLEQASQWLEAALTIEGIGAKTAAGYGWFSLRPDVLVEVLKEEDRVAEAAAAAARRASDEQARAEMERQRLATLRPEEQALERYKKLSQEEFAKTASGVSSLSAEEQKGFLLALLSPEKRETWKSWKKSDKPANKARVDALLACAQVHGVKLL
jgi:CRISPR type III-B/RAMP module RAMP protein Cmr6